MKSIRIYQQGEFEEGNAYPLDKPSSNHLIKVLRIKNNFIITLFNGDGNEYRTRLEISGKQAIAHIEEKIKRNNESGLNIHLLQGISKGERMDFAIQKSIELGVTQISPVVTERTVVNLKGERGDKKLSHWKNISISACEQSGRNTLPIIPPIQDLQSILRSDSNGLKILLDPESENTLHSLKPTKDIMVLIGPEGGLSDAEISLAKEHGFETVKFGPRILRTETAALAAVTAFQLLWGDL